MNETGADRAKRIASEKAKGEKASEQGTAVSDEPEKGEGFTGFTTPEEMLAGYEYGVASTSTGKRFEIEGIHPGDFSYLLHTPVLQLLIQEGVDLSSPEEVLKTVHALPPEEQLAFATQESFLQTAREIVCAGVTSMRFVMRRQKDCTGGSISIYRLTKGEIIEVYNAIMEMSIPREARERAAWFREVGNEERESPEDGQDTSDGEGLQPASIGIAVPESVES